MGVGMAGIGLSIMHDANHGSYSKNKVVNRLFGITLNLMGGSAKNWRIQHNRLHHTFTNVHEMDPDVSPMGLFVFLLMPLKKDSQTTTYLCLVLLWTNDIFLGYK